MTARQLSRRPVTVKCSYWFNGQHAIKRPRVSAWRGYYAVHRSLYPREGWTVTHAPSGLAIRVGIGSQRVAIALAREMHRRAGHILPCPFQVVEYADIPRRDEIRAAYQQAQVALGLERTV